VSGKSGVKMTGPYDFVPPDYWQLDRGKEGGAYGFNTETSPGAAIPPAECIRRMIPADHLWPQDDVWNFHAASGQFANTKIYDAALNARYGEPHSLVEYTTKSQAAAYDGERAMFEAYTRNRITAASLAEPVGTRDSSTNAEAAQGSATGVIQWMLNNAWPSTFWHLYDYYLVAAGGYFGTKKANEPLHPMYSYDDSSVVVSNLSTNDYKGLRLTARVLDFDMTEKFKREVSLDAPPDSVAKLFTLPPISDLSKTYFLDLRLRDAANKEVALNFYWLSTQPDTLDWAKSKWFYTPESQYADLTLLNTLPRVRLKTSGHAEASGAQVTLTNPTRSLAFMVRLRATDGRQGNDIAPAIWEDNYLSLLPGESRTIKATYTAKAPPIIQVDGWNVEAAIVK
jgi:exo-1,4-beta-D-glucosaminidase